MADKNKSSVGAFFSKFNFRGAIVPFVFLVVGILFIVFPKGSMNVICYVLGALMLAAGAARLALAFTLPAGKRFADVVFALVIIAVGVLLIAAQSTVTDFVTVVFGIVLIIDSVLKVEESMVLRKVSPVRWWAGIAVAVVCFALGVAVVALSFGEDTSEALMIVAGIAMLFDSLCSFAVLIFSAIEEAHKESPAAAPVQTDGSDGGTEYTE